MKQVFFKQFGFVDPTTGAQYRSKRFAGMHRMGHAAFKSDAPVELTEEEKKGKTDDEIKVLQERKTLLSVIQGKIDAALETRATKEELEAIQKAQIKEMEDVPLQALRDMADEKTGVTAQLAKMALRMQKLEQKANNVVKDMSVRGQVEAWMLENREALDTIKASGGKKAANLTSLAIRAVASPMLVSTVNAGASPYIGSVEVEKGINNILVYPNKFWESIKKGRTGAATYVWVNKTNREGKAAFIGPGEPKPGVSFAMVAANSIAKKIAVSAKTGTELLQDIDGMVDFIETELKEQLFIEMNTVLMSDDAATDEVPAGIGFYAVPYPAGVGIATTNPTHADALRAVVGYLRSGKLIGDITIYINSIDSANMDIAKATDAGVYLLPPFTSVDGSRIAGAKIIEDQNIPAGSFVAAFMRYYRILIYKDFTLDWGWENDDFTRNLVTAIAEMRIHQFVNNIHTGFAIKDTFVHVKAEITEPAAP